MILTGKNLSITRPLLVIYNKHNNNFCTTGVSYHPGYLTSTVLASVVPWRVRERGMALPEVHVHAPRASMHTPDRRVEEPGHRGKTRTGQYDIVSYS